MIEESPFRLFELTIRVHVSRHRTRLPHTFAEWIEVAFGISEDQLSASGTSLELIKELRYPLAEDVVEYRRSDDRRYW